MGGLEHDVEIERGLRNVVVLDDADGPPGVPQYGIRAIEVVSGWAMILPEVLGTR